MPPKRPGKPHTPSPTSRQVHDAAMDATFRTPRPRSMAWHFHPAHDPYAITAPIDPHSDGDGWSAADNLRGRPRGVIEYNDF
jgi:hypothetical protein